MKNEPTSSLNPTQPMTSASLRGQVAVVTGGGRGIGAATARLLALRGAKVLIVSRTESELLQTAKSIKNEISGAQIEILALDLSNPKSVNEVFNFAESKFSVPSQILVNNAAIGYGVPFLDTQPQEIAAEWEKIQAINIGTPLSLSHEFMRRLSQKNLVGSIVNLSSLGGIRATEKFPGLSLYVISKFAICGMTEALAAEGKSIGVRVNAVAPGAVDTEMLRKAAPHLKTKTTPTDVAHVIAYLCDDESSKSVTGTTIEIHSNL